MSGALAVRRFTMDDQLWFAQASGDWNPIHVDRTAARRLLTGEVIVHGMHAMLWALDRYLESGGTSVIASVTVSFLRPITLDVEVRARHEISPEGENWLILESGTVPLVTLHLGAGGGALVGEIAATPPDRSQPRDRTFADLKGASGLVALGGVGEDLVTRFPAAVKGLGAPPVAAILALSRIVGMECPGLNSLFSSADINFGAPLTSAEMSYSVSRYSIPMVPVTMTVAGGGVTGTVTAFFRPPPAVQADMAEIARIVSPGEFSGQRALIVGGSRGLGELTAKIVAAGGGYPIITFARGEMDAARVVAEIEAAGGSCCSRHLDVLSLDGMAVADLWDEPLTHLYYFATPRIGGGRRATLFDPEIGRSFYQTYVEAFASLCAQVETSHSVRVFYPSTVFLESWPRDNVEYVVAKAAGETLCEALNRHHRHLVVMCARLPRLRTDQTVSLIGKAPDDPLPIMVDIVRRMLCLEKPI